MRTTIVPAQITSIEDKVAGYLSVTQLGLLMMPVFLFGLMYAGLPPVMGLSGYKFGISGGIGGVSCLGAIRFNDHLLISWVVQIGRYLARPRFYIASKNDSYLRQVETTSLERVDETGEQVRQLPGFSKRMSTRQSVALASLLADPARKVRFLTNKKGRLDVHISKIK